MLKVNPQGDPRARVYLVGEAPGEDEEILGIPFIGASGQELNKLLKEAGLDRDECYVTNVCQYRPPGNDIEKWLKRAKNGRDFTLHPYVQEGINELKQTIECHRPRLVIGLGNTPLWALTGEWGIGAWRGSELMLQGGVPFVPTLHPAAILRSWDLRPLALHDLRYRCARRLKCGFHLPRYQLKTYPTVQEVLDYISSIEGPFAADIETSRGKTLCIGIARSMEDAMCIPFWDASGRIYSREEERTIIEAIHDLSQRCDLIGQNWNYDRQYLLNDYGLNFKPAFDTYIAQSVLFPGSERGLGYLSSMYCEWHVYWKEDAKDWNNIKDFSGTFRYNATDCARTWEVANVQSSMLKDAGLMEQFEDRMRYGEDVFRMMVKGVCRHPQRTTDIIIEVEKAIEEREEIVQQIAGEPVNIESPKQVGDLLFKKLGFKPTAKTPTGAPSTKDEALRKLIEKEPKAAEVCTPILEARSLSNIKSNFLEAELDPDGRLRSSWMATGTETFRLTSSKNAYHRGGPLQNITDGKHTHSGRPLPNLRATIVPPEGCIYWNCDLERADLQVVAWEAQDEALKDALRRGLDVHLVNAIDLFDLKGVPLDECLPSHSRYVEHKERHEQPRHFAKTFCHLTDYGGKERTCAIKTHTTVKKAEALQKRWFEIHPGILDWHRRVTAQLYGSRTVRNRFGFRRIYFDRVDSCITEALAWIPQSTVSLVISKVQMEFNSVMADVPDEDFAIELQGHDSLSGYMRESKSSLFLPWLNRAWKRVVVPYDDPLCIPLELSLGPSWGEVKKTEWLRA